MQLFSIMTSIVTSSDNGTQSFYVLFSPSVYYRNSQVINSIRTPEKKRKSLTRYVSEFRYLGHIISNQHKDDRDANT